MPISAPITVAVTNIDAPVTLARDAYQLAMAQLVQDGTNPDDLPTREEWLASLGDGGGVAVQNEGVQLPSVGVTLNFVGDGVTATGSGSVKTISIPGGGGSGGGAGIAVQSVSIIRNNASVAGGSSLSDFSSSDSADPVPTVETWTGVTDISPIFKSLLEGDSVLLGPGMYEWEGSFVNVPEQGSMTNEEWEIAVEAWYLATPFNSTGYADFAFPSNVTIRSEVPGAATIKFVQGKPTWRSFRRPLMAMSIFTPSTQYAIPMFFGKYESGGQVAAKNLKFIDLVIDINAEANIQYCRDEDNMQYYRPLADEMDPWDDLNPRWNQVTDSNGNPYLGTWLGMDPHYNVVVGMDNCEWTGCRIIHWTSGGSMVFSGTTQTQWRSGWMGEPGASLTSFQSKEHFVFSPGYRSVVKRCVFEEPFDVSIGMGPMGDQSTAYSTYGDAGGYTISSGAYVSVCCPWFGEHYEDCIVRMPESVIYKDESGADIDYSDAGHATPGLLWPSTVAWRERGTKWNLPDGSVGSRWVGSMSFALPSGDNYNDLPDVTTYTNCLAEYVSRAFHRDTGDCQGVLITGCSARPCVKGVNILQASTTSAIGLVIQGNHFEIIDYFYGADPGVSVENGGIGGGSEAGVYLFAYPAGVDEEGFYDGVTIADNVIAPVKNASFPSGYVPYSSNPFLDGGHAIALATASFLAPEGDVPNNFRNVVVRNNVVFGGLPSALVDNYVSGQYRGTRFSASNWESHPKNALYSGLIEPELAHGGMAWFHTGLGVNLVKDEESGMWVQTTRPESAVSLISTVAFCGDYLTSDCSGYAGGAVPEYAPSYWTNGYASWAIASLDRGIVGTSNPGSYHSKAGSPEVHVSMDFGYGEITCDDWLNTVDFHANMGGKTAKQLAIESNPDAFVIMFGLTEIVVDGMTGALALDEVEAVTLALRATGKRVFICTLPPSTVTDAQAQIDAFNLGVPALAASTDCEYVVTHNDLLLPGGVTDATTGIRTGAVQDGDYFSTGHLLGNGAAIVGLAIAEAIRASGGDYTQTVGSPYDVPAADAWEVGQTAPDLTKDRWMTLNPKCLGGYRSGDGADVPAGLSYNWFGYYFSGAVEYSVATIDGVNWQRVTDTGVGTRLLVVIVSPATVTALKAANGGSGALVRAVCRYVIESDDAFGGFQFRVVAQNAGYAQKLCASFFDNQTAATPGIPDHGGLMVSEPFKFITDPDSDSVQGIVQLALLGPGTVRITDFGLITDPSLIT